MSFRSSKLRRPTHGCLTLIELPGVSCVKASAFTLIELLVVIAVIAILTSLLFNLEDDPEERNDLGNDPEQAAVVERMMAKIRRRWSAEWMIEGEARTRRARELIWSCGHGFFPHPFEPEGPPENANQFDFGQLPDWEGIRSRVEKGET